MKIALLSYEYPPDASYGGIATYVHQAARMLAGRGHQVEVFTSSPTRSGTVHEDGIIVHRVLEAQHAKFPAAIAPPFERRHTQITFDVLESPEYGADAREAIRLVPHIPLVVKLHTPSFLLTLATYDGLRATDSLRWRLLAGRIREYARQVINGTRPSWHYTHKYALDAERALTLSADEIASPSRALAAILTEAWRLDAGKISHVPYPYAPSDALLSIAAGGDHGIVSFIGRLEVRKGVLDLASAIPLVLKCRPDIRFRFVGPDDESPRTGLGMREYLRRQLKSCGSSVEFLNAVPNQELPAIFATSDIIVIPSVWENFANVCLESMSAARAVVASEAGGLAEMMVSGETGRTVPPRDPHTLAQTIAELLGAPATRRDMGLNARHRVLEAYAVDRICPLQERSYARAIERRRAEGARAI